MVVEVSTIYLSGGGARRGRPRVSGEYNEKETKQKKTRKK